MIKLFTDEGDVVIDPTAGSGSSLIAAIRNNREAYGFEIKKDIHKKAIEWIHQEIEILKLGYAKTTLSNKYPTLW